MRHLVMNNVPLIEGLGQFGSRAIPDGIGAPRYTEVRRSKAGEAFLYNDLALVPETENYDGSNVLPIHFLPLIPVVLLNGVEGVAVGFSTKILPRALPDLIAATQAALRGTKKIAEPRPEYNNYAITVTALGDSQYEFTGRVTVENTSTLRVTELPPGCSLEDFKKRLIQMEERDEIINFLDGSADTIDVEIQMKRGTVKGWSERQAVDFLKLREKVTERITVVDWACENIGTYDNAVALIRDFAEWRLGWYEKRYARLLDEANRDLIYWKLLRALFRAGFTKKLGTFADRAAVEVDVVAVGKKAKLLTDDSQIDRAVSLPTYRWTKAFEAEVETKIAEIEARVVEYSAIMADPERRRDIYLDELDALKKAKL
ncbi:MAG: hypothetical protein EOO77_34895 [Oxalobacteraceae bacterium]|nr:MAG: hypothetical protein EOO77_34895 [Oxalobacteraceae bacterium]